jgi:hypothetical protein
MPRCAFLTMDSLAGFVSDDELAYAPLRNLGWQVEAVPWRQRDVDWSGFDVVVIRSTWDYQHAPDAFISVLEQIMRSGARLENALDLVRWNMSKTYLRDVENRGVRIVPTIWGSEIGEVREETILERLGTDEVVLKPVVGANADHAYRLGRGSAGWLEAAAAFAQRPYLAQPFISSIIDLGEYSLFFFGGELSHAVLKTPKPRDFRVQEEHGGIISAVTVSRELAMAGELALAAIAEVPLYARVDLVRLDDGSYGLMELELIEPSLYLRMDAAAPERFACALEARVRRRCRGGGGRACG